MLNHNISPESGPVRKPRGDAVALMKRLLIALAVVVLAAGASCHKGPRNEHRYELKGKVVAVDLELRKVTVAHDAVQGLMGPMTMPFVLKDEWAYQILRPGDRINAILVIDGNKTWLENIVVTEENPVPAGQVGAAGAKIEPSPGDAVPDFKLIDQDSKPIDLAQYRGGALVLTFVYTRCPLPDYCPLMSSNFATLDKDLQSDQALFSKTRLLSVTIDPEFDTPAVLKSYGGQYTRTAGDEGFNHWAFATGSEDQIKAISEYFGLRFWKENGQITHSLRTAVIGPDGKLAKLYRGNDWKPDEIVSELKAVKFD